ncbi:MAG: GEVED domain-containing protein, partial [Bacteroidota bacterium]
MKYDNIKQSGIFFSFLFYSFFYVAQCTNLVEYGFATAPTSGSITISTCSYQTEYSTINNVQAASIYQCEILNGGYITIRQGTPNGPVVTSGISPLTWTSTSAGTYYAHWNTDASCGTATTCETTTITYVSAAFPCSGVPAPGNTLCSVGNSVCPNASINLTLQNPMLGSGITYQWYSSTDGVNYLPIVGANAVIYSTSISVATYFYCSEDCSGSTTNSTPISLTIAPFNQCYCTPIYFNGTQAGDLISNVQIVGTTLSNNTGFVAGGPSYTFFTGQPNYTATLVPSNSYNLNISTGEWGSQGYAAWIDYNDDGIFDLTERIGYTIGTIGSGYTMGQINASSSFVISLACTPPVGSHRLRIRGAFFVDGD